MLRSVAERSLTACDIVVDDDNYDTALGSARAFFTELVAGVVLNP
jgi:hypothetical protein